MDIEKLMSEDVTENGLGDIKIGMRFEEFEQLCIKYDYFYHDKILQMNAVFPSHVNYTYFDSMTFLFDLKSSILVRIDLFNKFKGKLLGKIGIEDQVISLKSLNLDLKYDDDKISIGDTNKLVITVDDDLMSLDSEEANDLIIEEFTINFHDS